MILSALREHTRPQHERLEARLDILERTRALGPYRTLLERMYGFYAPVEAALAPLLREGAGWTYREKAPLLARDLAALGVGDVAALPLCEATPTLETPAQALGCLYVLEGATLGGQIISRHLRDAHGLDADRGAAFFHGYGPETGRMWKATGALLRERAERGDCDQAFVLAAARETFERYEAWVCHAEKDGTGP
ncbi:MAG TPA: biliverdin-producing heme oxygenase [Armatimonadaceae bacterium]|nr:biliverdin-producing heme oxygenase [Armatimonadaceae bacterium]